MLKSVARDPAHLVTSRTVLPQRVEWPTVAVMCTIAAGFVAILRWHDDLPTAVVVAVLAVLAAWYNSLQHEVVHGHPTPWRLINTSMAAIPLGLVVPFSWYRSSHLAHHRDEYLTDPTLDPESFYVSAAEWESCGRARRAVLRVLSTLPGRTLVGPPVLTMRMIVAASSALRTRPVENLPRVISHLAGVAAVLAVVIASGLEVWVYLLGAVWFGWSISLIRSFAEHRFVDGGSQSAVVRAGPVMSLLYLNNNLHLSHHARPGLPWYQLPAEHERLGADAIAAEGAGLYTSYLDVARRFAVHPFLQPVHPGWAAAEDGIGCAIAD
ncbi:MAG TPA: fatty acid desaturase [Ilumatobacteraceae bacterium]|nr:fatty acid desaturase [Ilumatobacteraceae bacterium]